MTEKIFVGNLPFTATKEDMEIWFGPFGEIIGINLRQDRYYRYKLISCGAYFCDIGRQDVHGALDLSHILIKAQPKKQLLK